MGICTYNNKIIWRKKRKKHIDTLYAHLHLLDEAFEWHFTFKQKNRMGRVVREPNRKKIDGKWCCTNRTNHIVIHIFYYHYRHTYSIYTRTIRFPGCVHLLALLLFSNLLWGFCMHGNNMQWIVFYVYSRHLLIPHLGFAIFFDSTDNIESNRHFCVWNFINSLFADNMSSKHKMLKYQKDIECFTAFVQLHAAARKTILFFWCFSISIPPCECVCLRDFFRIYFFLSFLHFTVVSRWKKTFWRHYNARKIFGSKTNTFSCFHPKMMTAALWILCYHVCIRPQVSVFLPKFIPWPSLLSLSSLLSSFHFSFSVDVSPSLSCAFFTLTFWLFSKHLTLFIYVFSCLFFSLRSMLSTTNKANIHPLEML